jgi:hypothetical protein
MQMKQWRLPTLAILLSIVLLGLGASHALALQVGDKAPDFSLPATTTETIKLADYLGKKPLVVFFYIAAFTGF